MNANQRIDILHILTPRSDSATFCFIGPSLTGMPKGQYKERSCDPAHKENVNRRCRYWGCMMRSTLWVFVRCDQVTIRDFVSSQRIELLDGVLIRSMTYCKHFWTIPPLKFCFESRIIIIILKNFGFDYEFFESTRLRDGSHGHGEGKPRIFHLSGPIEA